jgi:hypothetical protein
MKNSDMPAMPLDSAIYLDPTKPNLGVADCHGLTKREHFAAIAMGALTSGEASDQQYNRWIDLASDAVTIADALLAALEADN